MAPESKSPNTCHLFQLERCTNGAACKYAHVLDPTFKTSKTFKRKLCFAFLNDRCRFGRNCKFSHDQDAAQADDTLSPTSNAEPNGRAQKPPAQRALDSEEANTQAELKAWRRDIAFYVADTRPLNNHRLTYFFQQAEKLSAIEPGVTQEIITSLASDGGLKRIGELVGRDFDTLNDKLLVDVFRTQILPFYNFLSHQNVDRSALLESRVAAIYAYLFSVNGQRAVAMFKATVRFLRNIIKEVATDEDRNAADSCLFVMAKVMEINGSAHVTEPFIPIIEDLSSLFDEVAEAQEPFNKPACKSLYKIQQRLDLGKRIPIHVRAKAVKEKATFEAVADMPGELSDQGPRHDNDFASISQIKILPTLSEICAPRSEYLPSFDPKDWHVDGIEGLLDRHFRLVREDTVGQLRDAVKAELDRLQDPTIAAGRKDRKNHGARTFIYNNLRFENFGFDDLKGLEFAVSFDQPFDFRGKSQTKRIRIWEDSKRLGTDALVCLIDAAGAVTFFIVSTPMMFKRKAGDKMAMSHNLHSTYTRHGDRKRACAVLRFVEYDGDIAKQIMSFFDSRNAGGTMELVEFPGVLVPAFQPTLVALQKMSRKLDLPFADLVLQTTALGEEENILPPPNYAASTNFFYDLKAVTSGDSMQLTVGMDGDIGTFDMEGFKASTPLDPGQAEALIASLSRCFSITQGPPGTGKSFTGIALTRVLLDNKAKAGLGPLLLVSYTNHALDQMLEALVMAGVKKIVRIGSRSKSEMLAEVNLREVARKTKSTKTERSERYSMKNEIKSEGQAILDTLQELNELGSQPSIKRYLIRNNPDHADQLFNLVDDEGFETVDFHSETRLARWLGGELFPRLPINVRARSVEELSMLNIQLVSLNERRILHQHWISEMQYELRNDLARSIQAYNDLKVGLDLIRTETDLRTLIDADVIGVTTSGLARNLTLLRKLNSKVLISEEAGEVQEAHLLTAMLPSIEHVILIGDHLQLRPQVQNYALSSESTEGKQYCLDVSLFERLVKPLITTATPLPYSTLEVQRRMHPSIAELVRSTLYPALKDASNVEDYPGVAGMRRRLFWLNHENREDGSIEAALHTTSKTNEWEAGMVAALVRHIVRQGLYKPSDIAVLTPYLGQLRLLREQLRTYYEVTLSEGDAVELAEATAPVEEIDDDDDDDSTSEGGDRNDASPPRPNVVKRTLVEAVRLSTIDNFQGEEATVVIISLVRCNDAHNPGFLRTENRCNVLLSRAKHGMYIIGNAETAGVAPMWAKVLDLLQPDNIGDAFELCCPRHPEKALAAAEPEELFKLAPAGGCEELCDRQLNCGHACPEHCHSDLLHQDVYCLKDCQRPRSCGLHACPNPCGARCAERCNVVLEGQSLTLECGHVLEDPTCYQVNNLEQYACKEPITKIIPGCEHTVQVACWVDVQHPDYACPAICGATLPCAHSCIHNCAACNKREDGEITTTDHGECKAKCGRNYANCGHTDSSECHAAKGEACSPCKAKCKSFCIHAKCAKQCHEPCIPCAEEVCPSTCAHGERCEMPCGAPCDWIPCQSRCTKLLRCGCQCPGLCGEVCPTDRFCQNHGDEDTLSQTVDFIEFNEYRDTDLDSDPVIILNCGHVFTVSTLDGLMDMAKYYELDKDGAPSALKESNTLDFSKDDLKSCPNCRGTVRNIARYGRIIRRAILDEATKKFICHSNANYIPLVNNLMTEQDKLSDSALNAKLPHRALRLVGSRNTQIAAVREIGDSMRYKGIFTVRRTILRYQGQVKLAEQPFQRVRNMVEAVRRRKAGEGADIKSFDFDQSLLQTKGSLLGLALILRCDLTIISDVIAVRDRTPVVPRKNEELEIDFGANRQDCEKLIEVAQKSSHKVQEVEGHLFWAQFAALERNVAPSDNGGITIDGQQPPMERLKDEALEHLDLAEALCNSNASQTSSVSHEIDAIRKMLRDSVFYQPVSSDEMRAVVAAMANEFGVTGHWYRCVNGHPFTVGECGGPMQTSRCPECGQPVGGQNHLAAAGVTHAGDVESEFGRMSI